MTYTESAKSILVSLAEADDDFRRARDEVEDRVVEFRARLLRESVEPLMERRDMLAYLAKQEGVSVTDISHTGMKTRARRDAYAAIERGEALARQGEEGEE